MNRQTLHLLHDKLPYDTFRSEIYHVRKQLTTKEFLQYILQHNFIPIFWDKQWYVEAFYLLAFIDYLADYHHVPFYSPYDIYRSYSLPFVQFPSETLLMDKCTNSNYYTQQAIKECSVDSFGKYFWKYHLIEKGDKVLYENRINKK